MSDLNDKPGKKVNDRCCDVLAKALAAAKQGDYIAAAVIAIDSRTGQPVIMFGGSGRGTMAAYFGAAMLQGQLIAQSTAPSTLLRPGQLDRGTSVQ
jgi:hypothetical protein